MWAKDNIRNRSGRHVFQEILPFSDEAHHGLPEQKASPMGSVKIQTIQGTSKAGRRIVERHHKKRTQNVCTLGSRMVAIKGMISAYESRDSRTGRGETHLGYSTESPEVELTSLLQLDWIDFCLHLHSNTYGRLW